MWATLVGTLASTVVAAAGAWAFRRFSRREPEVAPTGTTLRHGPALGVVGGVFVALAVGVAVLIFADGPPSASWVWRVLGAQMALVLAAGTWLLASYSRARVVVRADGVASRDGFGREAAVAWGDVARVRYGRLAGALRVTGRDGQTVRIPALLHGADAVADLLERHVRAEGVAEAVERFRRARTAHVD